MTGRAAADVEGVRRVDEVGIVIASGQREDYEMPGRDDHAADLDFGRGDPRNRVLHHRQVSQQFLDGRPDGIGVVANCGQLIGVL